MTTAYTADKVDAVRPEFLWPVEKPGQQGGVLAGRIAKGMQHFLAGKPDKGKGLSAVRIGADCILAGINVLHSAIEDQPAGLFTKPRYVAAGVRGDALKRLHLRSFRFPVQRQEFEAYVLEHDIKLVVLDPVASHCSDGVNRFNDSIRKVTDPMAAFCGEHGIAVIWIEHLNKNTKSDSPLDAIGGSGSGLVAACRAGYFLGIDPDADGDRILAHVKGNFMEKPPAMRFELDVSPVPIKAVVVNEESGEPEIVEDEEDFPALVFTEECIFDPMRLIKPEKGEKGSIGRPDDKKQAACEWLTNYLFKARQDGLPATADFKIVNPREGVPAGRVFEDAKLAGMTEKTLRRAKTEMGVEILPVGGGRNAKWHLPQEIVDLLTGGDSTPEAASAPAEAPATDNGVPLTGSDAALAKAALDSLGTDKIEFVNPDGSGQGDHTVSRAPTLDPASDDFDAEVAKLLGPDES